MYWLCSFPIGDEAQDRVWNRLQEASTYSADYSVNFKFKIPENFKVGTLDSLLALSDDLTKVNSAVEGTVNKIRRQLFELQSGLPEDEQVEVWVEGMTPEGYLQRFAWNEAKYPSRRPPKDTVIAIMETVQKLDEDLKARASDFTQSRTAVQAILRKQTGSLAVRDLSAVVPNNQLVATENLTTLVAVVPKASRGDWLSSYEALTDFVVPRSSALVAEDADYSAFMVVLFRRAVDDFKAAARAKGFQAKEVASAGGSKFIEEGNSSSGTGSAGAGAAGGGGSAAAGGEASLAALREQVESKRAALIEWCLASYGEAFSSWIHVTAIRLFSESILRYGLPPQFLAVLMKPNQRTQTQLRKVLAASFGALGGQHFEGGGDDLYPYVSFGLNIEE